MPRHLRTGALQLSRNQKDVPMDVNVGSATMNVTTLAITQRTNLAIPSNTVFICYLSWLTR